MKKLLLLLSLSMSLFGENNVTDASNDANKTATKKVQIKNLTDQQVREQMAREAEHARTQSFAQGDDYNLKAVEINQESLKHIQSIEPDYDFDITDVYRDDI